MKRLYITDLDGTLFHGGAMISTRSAAMLNELIKRGALISVASARSPVGVGLTNLREVRFRLPLVLMNGAMLYDLEADRILESCEWAPETIARTLEICREGGKTPFLYRVEEGGKLDVVFTDLTSEGEREFYQKRTGKFPGMFRHLSAYPLTGVVYCSMQDTEAVLRPIQERLRDVADVDSVLYADNYRENNWYLEIFSARAGKGNGLLRLKKWAGADAVTAFGDNYNDIAMLEKADTACVVANGAAGVKAVADVIISSNEEDGVAAYIAADYAPDGKDDSH